MQSQTTSDQTPTVEINQTNFTNDQAEYPQYHWNVENIQN